jgi:UDP-N-acetylmuramate dehydrogenase
MNWRQRLPPVRGKLLFDEPLAPFTWFRVGGPADVLFLPADRRDLDDFLRALPAEVPRTVLGVGSNVIVRDGGLEGVVIRLAGRPFAQIQVDREAGRVIAGAGALDAAVARAAAGAGIAGLEFLAGIPGTLGGAVTMNAGCYGREIKDVLVAASGSDFSGESRVWELPDLGYSYRTSTARGMIWDQVILQGTFDDQLAINSRISEITQRRENTQPLREKTGGSTFKNPPGRSAWELVDAAGWRGKLHGGAMFSPLHANFMINTGEATAADLESLGEAVRSDVLSKFGIDLEWEIRRLGRPSPAWSDFHRKPPESG